MTEFWDASYTAEAPPPWDIAFRISADEYEGETRLQMQVEAVRTTVPVE